MLVRVFPFLLSLVGCCCCCSCDGGVGSTWLEGMAAIVGLGVSRGDSNGWERVVGDAVCVCVCVCVLHVHVCKTP